jgi:hypothetical protein
MRKCLIFVSLFPSNYVTFKLRLMSCLSDDREDDDHEKILKN